MARKASGKTVTYFAEMILRFKLQNVLNSRISTSQHARCFRLGKAPCQRRALSISHRAGEGKATLQDLPDMLYTALWWASDSCLVLDRKAGAVRVSLYSASDDFMNGLRY